MKIKSFLLVNLSIRNPDPNKVKTESIEYAINDCAITKEPHPFASVIND